jgi:hypothetical protein
LSNGRCCGSAGHRAAACSEGARRTVPAQLKGSGLEEHVELEVEVLGEEEKRLVDRFEL